MKRREEVDADHSMNLCRFCYPSEEEYVLYEDDSVYVMPSRGQFVPGYLLLISKPHADCMAAVVDDRIKRAKDGIAEVLEAKYGSAAFFEHGRTGSCYDRAENRICYHAHLHCLPVAADFTDEIANEFDGRRVTDVRQIADMQSESPHYLFVEPDDGDAKFFSVTGSIERQYLRKRACDAIGLDESEADWKKNPYWDRMAETAGELGDVLSQEIASE